VDDILFAHNQPGKGNASMVYPQSDSLGSALRAESDVYGCFVCCCTLYTKYSSIVQMIGK